MHEASACWRWFFGRRFTFRIPFELMRVYSPSAEVQGHGPGRKCCKPASATSRWSTWSPWATTRSNRLFGWARQRHLQLGLPLRAGPAAGCVVEAIRRAPGRSGVIAMTHPWPPAGQGMPAAAIDGWAACWMTMCTIGSPAIEKIAACAFCISSAGTHFISILRRMPHMSTGCRCTAGAQAPSMTP